LTTGPGSVFPSGCLRVPQIFGYPGRHPAVP